MTGDRFQRQIVGQCQRLAVLPRPVGRRDGPEVPVRVADDPLLRRPVYEDRRGLLSFGGHRSVLLTTGNGRNAVAGAGGLSSHTFRGTDGFAPGSYRTPSR